jgi:uncharacterized protein (TIGR02246 family)
MKTHLSDARSRSILLSILAIALAPVLGHANDTDAEQANRALAKAWESTWNAHDMQAFGKLLTEDIDWVNVGAGHGQGRETVVRNHARVHAGKFKNSVVTVNKVEVALIRPDVAIVHVSWGVRGDTDDDGTPRQPRDGLFTWVTVKEGGAWKIRASQNTNRTPVR